MLRTKQGVTEALLELSGIRVRRAGLIFGLALALVLFMVGSAMAEGSWTSYLTGARVGFSSRSWYDHHNDSASTITTFKNCRDEIRTYNNDSATLHLYREISHWPDHDYGGKTFACYTQGSANWGEIKDVGSFHWTITAITKITDNWNSLTVPNPDVIQKY